MDFTSAALLVGTVFGVTELIKRGFPKLTGGLLQAVVFVVSIATTFAVAKSDFAADQIVSGHKLTDFNNWSLIIVGAILAGSATVLHQVVSSIPSIGENQPVAPPAAGVPNPPVPTQLPADPPPAH